MWGGLSIFSVGFDFFNFEKNSKVSEIFGVRKISSKFRKAERVQIINFNKILVLIYLLEILRQVLEVEMLICQGLPIGKLFHFGSKKKDAKPA